METEKNQNPQTGETTSEAWYHHPQKEAGEDQEKTQKNQSSPNQPPGITPSDTLFALAIIGIGLTLLWYGPVIKADSERTTMNKQLMIDTFITYCSNTTVQTTMCDRLAQEANRQGFNITTR